MTKQLIQSISGNYAFTQMELGKDEKLYISTSYIEIPNDVFNLQTTYLLVINHPNLEGLACDLDTNTISLGGNRVVYGLPNMPNYNLGPLAGSECDTLSVAIQNTTKENTISIYPNPTVNTITFSTPLQSGDQIIISSFEGKMVKQFNIQQEVNHIDVSSLSTGMYIITISHDNNIKLTDKLFIIKPNN